MKKDVIQLYQLSKGFAGGLRVILKGRSSYGHNTTIKYIQVFLVPANQKVNACLLELADLCGITE